MYEFNYDLFVLAREKLNAEIGKAYPDQQLMEHYVKVIAESKANMSRVLGL